MNCQTSVDTSTSGTRNKPIQFFDPYTKQKEEQKRRLSSTTSNSSSGRTGEINITESMSDAEKRAVLFALLILASLFLFGAVSGLSQHTTTSSHSKTSNETVYIEDQTTNKDHHHSWTSSLKPFLPGLSPTEFAFYDIVPLKVSSLRSPELHPNEPVLYYELPMCEPRGGVQDMTESLGEQLLGEVFQSSPYLLQVGSNLPVSIPDDSSSSTSLREVELEEERWQNVKIVKRKYTRFEAMKKPKPKPKPVPEKSKSHDETNLPSIRKDCVELCTLEYNQEQVKHFESRVKGGYRLRWNVDGLPNMLPIEMSSKDGRRTIVEYELGMTLGRELTSSERKKHQGAKVCLHSAIHIDIDIYEMFAPNSTSGHPRGAYRIVGFQTIPLDCVPLYPNASHVWQYSVSWHKSSTSWASRWDVYTRPNRETSGVQYLSLGLSLGMLLFIGFGMLITIKGKAQKQMESAFQRTVKKVKGLKDGVMQFLSRKNRSSTTASFSSTNIMAQRKKNEEDASFYSSSSNNIELKEIPGQQDPALEEGEKSHNSPSLETVEETKKTDLEEVVLGGGGGGGGVQIFLEGETGEPEKEVIWRTLRPSIFVPPQYAEFFAAIIGIGTQLAASISITLLVGLVALAYDTQRGLAIQVVVWCYLALGALGGYAAGIVYRVTEKDRHGKVLLLLVLPLSAFVFGSLALLNLILYHVGSSAAVPFWMLALVATSWTLFGGVFSAAGYGISAFCVRCSPCVCVSPGSSFGGAGTTSSYSSMQMEIPKDRGWYWKSHFWRLLYSTGVFAAISIPLYYLFSSVWGYLFYTAYGALLLTGFTAALLTMVSSLSYIWTQITVAEDWRWWWSAWYTAAAPSLHFIVFAAAYYLWASHIMSWESAVLYFGYVFLLAGLLALTLGALGVWACLIFLTWLYKLEKQE